MAGRTFGYLWPLTNTVGLKQTIAEQLALVGERPDVFEVQFTAGGFGWVVAHLERVPRDELAELVFEAWRLTAPVGSGRGARRRAADLRRTRYRGDTAAARWWSGRVDAAEIADAFGLGRAVRLSDGPVARGKQGEVWRLETAEGRWAVKVPFERVDGGRGRALDTVPGDGVRGRSPHPAGTSYPLPVGCSRT